MNIYNDTMPPVFVALRFTLIAFIGIILIVSVNILTADRINRNERETEQKINSDFFPGAASFSKKAFLNSKNRNVYYYESYDGSNALTGYVVYGNCKDYGDTIRIAAAINADFTVKNLKIIDNYRMIADISNFGDFNSYVKKIRGVPLKSLGDYKNGVVFNINKDYDYRNQVAFNAVIDCLKNMNDLLNVN